MATCSFSAHAFNRVAIVIDDIGYKVSDRKLVELDAPLTYAVLPHTPLGFDYAQLAYNKKRDVIIHVPMQANANNRLLGPGALTQQMDKQEYQQTLLSAMEDIPFAVGMNNHMGSLLTRMEQPMEWTMELLRQHNMFFLDSKTTTKSKISEVASKFGVDSLDRNVFLDHHKNKAAIERQFNRMIAIAKRHGSAIAIGHPYQETFEVLKNKLPELEAMGIELVPLSSMLPNQNNIYFAEQKRSNPDNQITSKPEQNASKALVSLK
jgi:hypothetical protein